ncbi:MULTISPECIES: hydrolase [Ignavibacterium]|jgi:nicotinamidase-related amidase|uniref:hydrolase n=1 Tax=Ignavibacterium TaxID=795750 RepID=UPI0025C0FDE2|nr:MULTISPECIES: hydrolase [Ignavibacterium]MBI5661281.1 hydrolase [Ignavibacterium album]
MKRNPIILRKETSALLIIDLQEKILPVIKNIDSVLENTIKLIKGFKILQLPIFYTEQYPKGLGPTSSRILEELNRYSAIQKMSFSCFGAENLFNEFRQKRLSQIVVCGVESHVCVQQTVLDLIANDFQVNVVADAVSSRREFDFLIALERMRTLGAEITTAESILFELLEVCGTTEFKEISKIIK